MKPIMVIHEVNKDLFEIPFLEYFILSFDDALFSQYYYWPLIEKIDTEKLLFISPSLINERNEIRDQFAGTHTHFPTCFEAMSLHREKDDRTNYMTINEIKALRGVTIGSHSFSHYKELDMSLYNRINHFKHDTELMLEWFSEHLNVKPDIYAFPHYKEYQFQRSILKTYGFNKFYGEADRDIIDTKTSKHPRRELTDHEKKFLVYVNNTEPAVNILNHEDTSIDHYISVCSGMKSIYKCAIDWYPGKQFRFTYVDIVPTAVDFRKHFDALCCSKPMSEIYLSYPNEIRGCFHNCSVEKIDQEIEEQIKFLGIADTWDEFLVEYKNAPKIYLNLDAINEVNILNEIISRFNDNKWFWCSNIFDWDEVNYSKEQRVEWLDYLRQHNPNIQFWPKICRGLK